MTYDKKQIDNVLEYYDFTNPRKYKKRQSDGDTKYDIEKIKNKNGISKAVFIFDDVVLKVSHRSKDYAMIELDNYNKAKDEGLEFFFPETEFYTENDGHNFTIQERVDCNVMRESLKQSKHLSQEDRVRFLMSNYEDEDVDRLVAFIKKNHIDDLSPMNFGYRLDNDKCVITDFSGYM